MSIMEEIGMKGELTFIVNVHNYYSRKELKVSGILTVKNSIKIRVINIGNGVYQMPIRNDKRNKMALELKYDKYYEVEIKPQYNHTLESEIEKINTSTSAEELYSNTGCNLMFIKELKEVPMIKLVHTPNAEIEHMFQGYSRDRLLDFLNTNEIPYKNNFSNKKLLEHTIKEVEDFCMFYRIGNE